jgi:hypothetical protein
LKKPLNQWSKAFLFQWQIIFSTFFLYTTLIIPYNIASWWALIAREVPCKMTCGELDLENAKFEVTLMRVYNFQHFKVSIAGYYILTSFRDIKQHRLRCIELYH